MRTTPSTLWQVVRFCIAGVTGVLTYYVTLYYLTEYAGLWYLASSFIGLILNMTVNFVLQRSWTFKNKEPDKMNKQAVEYLALSFGTLLVNSALLYLIVEYMQLWYIAAQFIVTVALAIPSYIISGHIFKNHTVTKTRRT